MTTARIGFLFATAAMLFLPGCPGDPQAAIDGATIADGDAATDAQAAPDVQTDAGVDPNCGSTTCPGSVTGLCSTHFCPTSWATVTDFVQSACQRTGARPPEYGARTSRCGDYNTLFFGDQYVGQVFYFDPNDGSLIAVESYTDTCAHDACQAGPPGFTPGRPCQPIGDATDGFQSCQQINNP